MSAELEAQIKEAGDKVRELKAAKASKDEVTAAVGLLLSLKEQLPPDHPDFPKPKGKKGKSKAAPAPAATPAAPASTGGALDGLKAAVDAAAEKVKGLKAAKASKEEVTAAVDVLLKAKAAFTEAGGVLENPVKPSKGDKKASKDAAPAKADKPKAEKKAPAAKPAAAKPAAGAAVQFTGEVTVYPGDSVAIKAAASIAGLKVGAGAPPAATAGAPMPAGTAAVLTADGVLAGWATVLNFCCEQSDTLAASSPLEAAMNKQWLGFRAKFAASSGEAAKELDAALLHRSYLGGNHLSAADLGLFEAAHPVVAGGKAKGLTNLNRWFEHIQTSVGPATGLAPVACSTTFFVPKIVAGAAPKPKAQAKAPKGGDAPAKGGAPAPGEKPQMSEKQAAKKKAKDDAKAAKKAQGGDDKAAKAPKAAKAAGDWNVSHLKVVVGTIVKAWKHPDSDKLWCEEIDCGEGENRQIASGLRAYYPEEADMKVPRKVLVLANLKPKKLGGFPSNGMVLCASNADKSKTIFCEVPEGAPNGEQIKFEGFEGEPATPAQMDKKKVFETVAPMLKVADDGTCTGAGVAFSTSAGPCKAPGMAGSHIA